LQIGRFGSGIEEFRVRETKASLGGGVMNIGEFQTDRSPSGQKAAMEVPLLDVRDLSLRIAGNATPLIRDVSFSVRPGERVGIVGESGCGKTMTGLSILRLLQIGRAHV
jgi:peptide/nickel transport system ATP-binding protein